MNNVELLTEKQLLELDSGICWTVQWLREHGFDTTDSGDGSKAGTMECALPYPNVTMRVSPDELVVETRRLQTLLVETGIDVVPLSTDDQPCVQGSYDPADDVAIVVLFGVNDAILQDAIVNSAARRRASQEQLRVFNEMRPLRARANAAVLGNGDGDGNA